VLKGSLVTSYINNILLLNSQKNTNDNRRIDGPRRDVNATPNFNAYRMHAA